MMMHNTILTALLTQIAQALQTGADPLRVMAWLVVSIDLLLLVGSLGLSYVLMRYRRGIAAWYYTIKEIDQYYAPRDTSPHLASVGVAYDAEIRSSTDHA